MAKKQQSPNLAFIYHEIALVMDKGWDKVSFLQCYKAGLGRRKNGTFSSLESPEISIPMW